MFSKLAAIYDKTNKYAVICRPCYKRACLPMMPNPKIQDHLEKDAWNTGFEVQPFKKVDFKTLDSTVFYLGERF